MPRRPRSISRAASDGERSEEGVCSGVLASQASREERFPYREWVGTEEGVGPVFWMRACCEDYGCEEDREIVRLRRVREENVLPCRINPKNMKTMLKQSLVLGALSASAPAASLVVGFQATVGSEQNANATSEGGPYHVSVNPNNPGYAAIAADLPNSGDPAPNFQRPFTEPVQGYAFVGGGPNNVLTFDVRESGGLITYTTNSTSFDGFGQNQLQLWTATDPGTDLTSPASGPDFTGPGYRGGFVDATAEIDISSLATGTAYVFYGDFRGAPSLSAVMRDVDGGAPDLTISEAHLNGDSANRGEYYVAEFDFVNDAGYDTIEYTWNATGDGGSNGRFGGTVLTGTVIPEPSSIALLGLGGFSFLLRRRRK